MFIKRSIGILLAGTVLGASVATPVFAQDAQTLQQLRNEIKTLQRQLRALEEKVAQAKKPAPAPRQAAQNLPSASPSRTAALHTNAPSSWPSWLPKVEVSLAGTFIEAAGVWRQRNENASAATDTPFSSLPFPNSPLYHEHELGFSAQQSRLALKAKGSIDPFQHLTAYFEMDFLGAGVTANARESNSYNLRIRQAYLTYDNDYYHFHVLAGQAFSLLTQTKTGITTDVNLPLTIDAQYVVGFNWTRQPQFRFVADWEKIAWFGFSVESPQINFPSNSIGIFTGPQAGTGPSQNVTAATAIGGAVAPPGLTVNTLNACQAGGLLNSTTSCSINNYPDLVQKFALDPGWGHYEVVGIERFFTDRVFTTAVLGSGSNRTTTGWGVGGSALMPVWPKVIDLQGSVLYGAGLGRYASSQLPDVTIGPDGTLTPLTTFQFLVGAVIHPVEPLDLYVYYGREQLQPSYWRIGVVNGGYGNPNFLNTGCLIENQASGPAGFNDPIAGTVCSAASNVERVQEITAGFWYNLYSGDMGRLRYGMQYKYVSLTGFPGLPGVPTLGPPPTTPNQGLSTNNQGVFVSLRYYPFK